MTTAERTSAPIGAVLDVVRDYAGLAFPPIRRADLERTVRKAMVHAHVRTPADFADLLRTDNQALDELIVDLTVGETYFFREPAQFEVLRRDILPELRQNLCAKPKLRFWSAGCASGEEAYTLAILLEQEGLAENATIIGTDISRAAIARAREAEYGTWSLRSLPADVAGRYFDRRGESFVLPDRLRRRVKFTYLNLASDDYPAVFNGTAELDVIMCRNVLIYFEREAVEKIAERLFAALAEDGWLILGPSDPPLWDLAPFKIVMTEAGAFYRRGGHAPKTARPRTTGQYPASVAARPAESSAIPEKAGMAADVPLLSVAPDKTDFHLEAVRAFESGDFDSALRWAGRTVESAEICLLKIRAYANLGDAVRSETTAAVAAQTYRLSPEIHYLHAISLMSLKRYAEATRALRRVIYLDRSLAVAHFTLGSVLQRCGAHAEARRFYQRALTLCDAMPDDEVLPLSEGERPDRLAGAAKAQLALLNRTHGAAAWHSRSA